MPLTLREKISSLVFQWQWNVKTSTANKVAEMLTRMGQECNGNIGLENCILPITFSVMRQFSAWSIIRPHEDVLFCKKLLKTTLFCDDEFNIATTQEQALDIQAQACHLIATLLIIRLQDRQQKERT